MMNDVMVKLNRTKAIESILYISNRIPNPDTYGVCKTLYVADKLSLERFGRFIFDESYAALQEGATPSKAYNIIKVARTDSLPEFKVINDDIIVSRDANLEWLSQSDIQCLDEVIAKYGANPVLRRDLAHDEAWSKSWSKRGTKKSVPIPIEEIAKTLPDSNVIIDYLNNCNAD